MPENPVIQVSSLSFSWNNNDKILDGISFILNPGEHVSIIGRNGAGKSTLLKCLAGLLKPESGNISLFGKPLEQYSTRELARHVAFLPQAGDSAPSLKVRDVVATGRYPHKSFFEQITSIEDEQAVESALILTGMMPFADRPLNTLSGGERQKVMLAAAIAQETPILLLDEPFTFLDPARQAEFEEILEKLHAERNITIITVTHDLNRAAAAGGRIIGITNNNILFDGNSQTILSEDNLQKLFGRKLKNGIDNNFSEISNKDPLIERTPHSETQSIASLHEIQFQTRRALSLQKQRLNLIPVLLFSVPIVVLFVFVFAMLGSPILSPQSITDKSLSDYQIFWQWRLPRAVAAFLVGSGLALAGAVFQAIFRNPLATPYTLGISSGASFGVIAAMQLGITGSILGITVTQASAFLGALLSIAIVYGLFSTKRRSLSLSSMLLAGVACSFLFSSLIMLLQYLCNPAKTIHTLYWMMGGIYVSGFSDILKILPVLVIGMTVVPLLAKELDVMLLGDDISRSRGVNVHKTRIALFFIVSLITAVLVSLCGPIGFVGMMIPHICRLITGPLHKTLLPVSIAAGGIFLLICDTLARSIISPIEIPIGVITSFFGAPFLLFLLSRNKNI